MDRAAWETRLKKVLLIPTAMADKDPAELVAYCGLYCGACGSHTRGRCPSCKRGEGNSWCTVRPCCIEKGIASCAECDEFDDLYECNKLNNFMSKFFGFIFRSDRVGSLESIRKDGIEAYAKRKDDAGSM